MTDRTDGDLRNDLIGVIVRCVVCGRSKKPIGRSAPLTLSPCDDECPGYRQPPYVGSLWPGESEAEFGYPVGLDGTAVRVDLPKPAVQGFDRLFNKLGRELTSEDR